MSFEEDQKQEDIKQGYFTAERIGGLILVMMFVFIFIVDYLKN